MGVIQAGPPGVSELWDPLKAVELSQPAEFGAGGLGGGE